MSTPVRIAGWKARRARHGEVIDFRALGWLMRRVAVWETLFGPLAPWRKVCAARLFLGKNWKHLECVARKEFAHDAVKRWQR